MVDAGSDLRKQLRVLFREELEDNLRVLTEGFLALEAGCPSPPAAGLIQGLFRAAHSLKGAAHAAAQPSAVAVCGRLEDSLAAVRAGERVLDEALLGSLFDDLDQLQAVAVALRTTPGPSAEGGGGPAQDVDPGSAGGHERVRVGVDRLGSLVGQSAELNTSAHRLAAVAAAVAAARDLAAAAARHGHLDRGRRDFEGVVQLLDRLAGDAATLNRDLRRAVTRLTGTALALRLQPFTDVCAGLERTVRDLSKPDGKRVELVIEGGDVELDRDIAAALREPIVHLVRNAVDHGIETPATRTGAGKVAHGTLRLTASALGARLEVVVADDGAGIDTTALHAAAARQGIAVDQPEEAAFAAGISTAGRVTEVSGRGIGLDAVRARIEALGGSVRLRSQTGAGTRVVLQVPITLSTMRVLLVGVGGELIALPMASVHHLERVDMTALRYIEGRTVLDADAGPVPVIDLGRALGFEGGVASEGSGLASIVRVDGDAGALRVDGFEGELEGTLRPLPARAAASAVMGAVTLPTGRIALVVNPVTTVRHGLTVPGASAAPPRQATVDRSPRLLLAEDSVTTRALERNILAAAGYDVVVAVDGREAWAILQEYDIDLVVSDVDMPVLDGIELCRRMRSSTGHRDTPVVLVTSLADEADRRRGLDAGANAYIAKSAFEQAALLDAIRRLL